MSLEEQVRRFEQARAERAKLVDQTQQEIDSEAEKTAPGIPLGQAIKNLEHPRVKAQVDAARKKASKGWKFEDEVAHDR